MEALFGQEVYLPQWVDLAALSNHSLWLNKKSWKVCHGGHQEEPRGYRSDCSIFGRSGQKWRIRRLSPDFCSTEITLLLTYLGYTMAAPGSKAPARLAKVRWMHNRSAGRAKQATTARAFWNALAWCYDSQCRKSQKRQVLKWLLEFIPEVNFDWKVAFCGDSRIGSVAHTYTLNKVIWGFKAG